VNEAREVAVQALYEADQLDLESIPERDEIDAKARRLIDGTMAHRDELDESIDVASDRWRVERMPVVDRAIVRLALYELRYEPDMPTGVILSEAVRIAKQYSTDKSAAFVNGILAGLAARER
jgi:N utilization substance protein B